MVLSCQDLPLWPCPSIVGDSMGTSHLVSPSSTPSPAPQAPLGSQRIRGRKEALCLGRGRPGKASKGLPQPQECGKTLRPQEPGCPGPVQSCFGSPLPLFTPASSPCWGCFLPRLPRDPFPPESLFPLTTHLSPVALE